MDLYFGHELHYAIFGYDDAKFGTDTSANIWVLLTYFVYAIRDYSLEAIPEPGPWETTKDISTMPS